MNINTRQFGEVTIDKEKIILVPKGLPGFPELTRYILLEHESIQPFISLQSVEEESLAFYIMDPVLFDSDYKVNLEPHIKEMKWEDKDRDNTFLYVILNVTDKDPKKITANLLGPLLINIAKNQAVQILINNEKYSHKHLVFEDINNKDTESK